MQTPLFASGVLRVWSPEPIHTNYNSANREQNLHRSANGGDSDMFLIFAERYAAIGSRLIGMGLLRWSDCG